MVESTVDVDQSPGFLSDLSTACCHLCPNYDGKQGVGKDPRPRMIPKMEVPGLSEQALRDRPAAENQNVPSRLGTWPDCLRFHQPSNSEQFTFHGPDGSTPTRIACQKKAVIVVHFVRRSRLDETMLVAREESGL